MFDPAVNVNGVQLRSLVGGGTTTDNVISNLYLTQSNAPGADEIIAQIRSYVGIGGDRFNTNSVNLQNIYIPAGMGLYADQGTFYAATVEIL